MSRKDKELLFLIDFINAKGFLKGSEIPMFDLELNSFSLMTQAYNLPYLNFKALKTNKISVYSAAFRYDLSYLFTARLISYDVYQDRLSLTSEGKKLTGRYQELLTQLQTKHEDFHTKYFQIVAVTKIGCLIDLEKHDLELPYLDFKYKGLRKIKDIVYGY